MSMTKIATITVGAGGATSIDFQSIPQTFSDLRVVASIRNSGTSEHALIGLNGSTANFTGQYLSGYGSGGATSSGSYARYLGNVSRAGYTAGTFGSTTVYIPNYTSANNKLITAESISENNDTSNWAAAMSTHTWAQSAAITSLQITNENGTLLEEGSTATLYGITDATKYYPKATGGTITTDADYIYHTFTASGTFTPTASLTADVLVIAGGGGGGGNFGGGGGAGGVVSYSSQSLSATGYTVVVGAGGSGDANGNNSQFGALTAAVAGGAGYGGRGAANGTANSGGSGGGGGGGNTAGYTGFGGSGTSGQGSNGGTGTYNRIGGGGGGAGGVGGNASGSTAGVGGSATSTYSAWATATGTGVSGAYAGGGGGASLDGYGSANVGGGGGAGNGSSSNGGGGGNAIARTGAGGGGGPGNGYAGSGGSGVVIIRYGK